MGRLAVPAHREVPRLVCLDVQDRVQDDHPFDGRYLVLDLPTALRVAPEDLQLRGALGGIGLVLMYVGVSLGGHLFLLGVLPTVFVAHLYSLSKRPGMPPSVALKLALFSFFLSTVLVRDLCVSLFVEQPGEMLRHRRYLAPLYTNIALLVLLHDEVYLAQLVARPVVVEAPLGAPRRSVRSMAVRMMISEIWVR